MVKSYSISVGEDDSKVDRFVALMVPAEALPPRLLQGDPASSRCAAASSPSSDLGLICGSTQA